MTRMVYSKTTSTRLAAWLMLLAISIRVLIPQGWMPNLGGHSSGFSLVICSIHGTYQLPSGGNGQQPADHEGQPGPASDSMCPYALLGALSSAADAPAAHVPQVQSMPAQPGWTNAPVQKWRVHAFGARSPPLA